MSIYDFCGLLTDDGETIAVYDYTREDEIFRGSARDTMFESFSDYEILAIDIVPDCDRKKTGVSLVLNIETESDD